MDVLDATDELLKVLACLLLSQPLVLHDDVEQFSARGELHHQVKILLSLDDFIDLDDVGMMKLLENLDLSADALDVFLVFDSRLFENFDGNLKFK